MNEVIDKICSTNKDYRRNKKGQQSFYELLPCEVGLTDEMSNHFIEDMGVLAHLESSIFNEIYIY